MNSGCVKADKSFSNGIGHSFAELHSPSLRMPAPNPSNEIISQSFAGGGIPVFRHADRFSS